MRQPTPRPATHQVQSQSAHKCVVCKNLCDLLVYVLIHQHCFYPHFHVLACSCGADSWKQDILAACWLITRLSLKSLANLITRRRWVTFKVFTQFDIYYTWWEYYSKGKSSAGLEVKTGPVCSFFLQMCTNIYILENANLCLHIRIKQTMETVLWKMIYTVMNIINEYFQEGKWPLVKWHNI